MRTAGDIHHLEGSFRAFHGEKPKPHPDGMYRVTVGAGTPQRYQSYADALTSFHGVIRNGDQAAVVEEYGPDGWTVRTSGGGVRRSLPKSSKGIRNPKILRDLADAKWRRNVGTDPNRDPQVLRARAEAKRRKHR